MMLERAAGCYYGVGSAKRVRHNLLDLAEDVSVEIYFQMREVFFQVELVLAECQLVALLVPAVVV